ncbi:Flagellar protein FliS [bacterium HR40]|nr:Flagellar protein FliS [bacterium HR40]
MTVQLAARAFDAYGRASATIPPLEQIVMLYDAAILRVKEARAAIERGDVEGRFLSTRKAIAILEALQSCLDHDRGGEIARLLDRCYTYLILRLAEVNRRNAPALCDEILDRLGELRRAWAELSSRPSGLSGGDRTAVPLAAATTA